jgi:hypothetical protein
LLLEFKTGSWSGLLPSVIAGQADLMWSNLYYTPTRAEQIDFVTFLSAATRGMVRNGNPKNIHSLDDACGVRAAAGLGSVEYAMFNGLSEKCVAAGKLQLEIVTYPDRPTGIRMLLNDRADLLMGDAGGNAYAIKPYPNELESAYTILTNYKAGPGISKKPAGTAPGDLRCDANPADRRHTKGPDGEVRRRSAIAEAGRDAYQLGAAADCKSRQWHRCRPNSYITWNRASCWKVRCRR